MFLELKTRFQNWLNIQLRRAAFGSLTLAMIALGIRHYFPPGNVTVEPVGKDSATTEAKDPADKPVTCEDIRQYIKEIAPIYGVNPVLIMAMAKQESNCGQNNFRFEPTLMNKAASVTHDEEEQIWLSSSHGPLHVLGFTAAQMGLHRTELKNPKVATEAGIAWYAHCVENQLKRNPKLSNDRVTLMTLALTEYNGSPVYVKAVLAHVLPIISADV